METVRKVQATFGNLKVVSIYTNRNDAENSMAEMYN
jgi:hypothetical protein